MDKPLSKWTVNELKSELKNRGLPQTGLKAELAERLEKVFAEEAAEKGGVDGAAVNDQSVGDGDPTVKEIDDGDDMVMAEDGEGAEPSPEETEEAGQQMELQEGEGTENPAANGSSQPSVQEGTQEEQEPPLPPAPLAPEEWEEGEIPEHWKPLPVMKVKNISEQSTPEDLRALLESAGVPVKSVVLEDVKPGQKKVAYIRLTAPPVPWKRSPKTEESAVAEEDTPAEAPAAEEKEPEQVEAKESEETEAKEEGDTDVKEAKEETAEEDENAKAELDAKKEAESKAALVKAVTAAIDEVDDGDVAKISRGVANKLVDARLTLAGDLLLIESSVVQCTLFIGNLPHDDDEKLQEELSEYGQIERCFVMRNPEGLSKGYGYCEYSLPVAAIKAKEAMERKTALAQEAYYRGTTTDNMEKPAAPTTTAQAEEPETKQETEEEKAEPAGGTDAEAAEAKEETGADAPMETEVKEVPEAEEEKEQPEAVKEEDEKDKEVIDVDAEAKDEAKEEATDDAAVAADAEEKEAEVKDTPVVESKPPAPAPALIKSPVRKEQIKIMRVEHANTRTIPQLYSRNLYVANLPETFNDREVLKSICEEYGSVTLCQIVTYISGSSKGYAFVEFKRTDEADKAMRALDGVEHPRLGKLLVSFVNPAKAPVDRRSVPMRPTNFSSYAPRGGAAAYNRGGRVGIGYTQRGGQVGGGYTRGGYAGRVPYGGAVPRGGFPYGGGRGAAMPVGTMGGRGGYVAPRGRFSPVPQATYQQHVRPPYGGAYQDRATLQLHQMQQRQQASQMLAVQASMQAQVKYLNQVQAQARQAQQQLQTLQQQAAKARQEAAAAERAKLLAEQEAARKRQEAARIAAMASHKPAAQTSAATAATGYGQGYGTQQGYGTHASGYGATAQQTSQGYQGYGQAGYSTGYSAAQQGSQAAGYGQSQAQGQSYGSAGYGTQAAYGSQTGYGTQSQTQAQPAAQSGYASQSGYGATQAAAGATPASGYGGVQQSGYGAATTGAAANQTGYGAASGYGAQAAYGSSQATGYGAQQSAYGSQAASGYGQSAYGTAATAGYTQAAAAQAPYTASAAAGQKRDVEQYQYPAQQQQGQQQQASAYGSYAGTGYGSTAGQDYKRPRY